MYCATPTCIGKESVVQMTCDYNTTATVHVEVGGMRGQRGPVIITGTT